jgi:SAM-dependent methyltransferase
LDTSLHNHLALLKEVVFDSDHYLPQFNLLLDEISKFSQDLQNGENVVSLERTLLYGKNIFAPFFQKANFTSLDCSPKSADGRGDYNRGLIDDSRFIDTNCKSIRCTPDNLKVQSNFADLLMIPNLVHHVASQSGLFTEAFRVTKPGGRLFVFEPILRELHQEPDDFLRYTPYGMVQSLEAVGFKILDKKTTGGPFTAIAYCWNQALQYIPDEERVGWSEWFEQHFKDLELLESKYAHNLIRKYTSFPTAFAITCEKPF